MGQLRMRPPVTSFTQDAIHILFTGDFRGFQIGLDDINNQAVKNTHKNTQPYADTNTHTPLQ